MDHTPLRLRSSRRRELRISDIVPRTSLSLSLRARPSLYFLSFSVLPYARSQTFLSLPSFFSLLYFCFSLFLFSPFLPYVSLALTFRPFPSFLASVVPYISRFLSGTLRAALCTFFFLSRSSISFSFCPRHAFRPRAGRTDRACSRLSWPPHGLQDRVRGRSLLLCSGRCGDPREEKERERNSYAKTRTRRERPL